MYYWANKQERSNAAIKHTKDMQIRFATEIKDAITATKVYSINSDFSKGFGETAPKLIVEVSDSVKAITDYSVDGKIAVLNFASYRNPGGGFIKGSSAQEECLCHDSFLYNVLHSNTLSEFYEYNELHLNDGLYSNRALYTPRVYFESANKFIDVITCASPNWSYASRNCTMEANKAALRDRIKFIINVAEDNNVDLLIAGAFGCGVFKQDATYVANCFKENLGKSIITTVVFPIPDEYNFKKMYDVLMC